MAIIAISIGLVATLIFCRQVLQLGLLLSQGKKFLTHNVNFKQLPSGELHLKAKGGLLTDKFDIKLKSEEIDLSAFANGHRPMDKGLDKAGYKVYRLVHIQHKDRPEQLRTTVGDFTLRPTAQTKFKKFTEQLSLVNKAN